MLLKMIRDKLLLMINSGVEINKLYLEVLWMIQK